MPPGTAPRPLLHKARGPQGSERLPTPSSPPPARSPQMGDLSGSRALAWALLALLWVPKAGEWTLTPPHGGASTPLAWGFSCRTDGRDPTWHVQGALGPPGKPGPCPDRRHISFPRVASGDSSGSPAAVECPLEAGLQGAVGPAAGATSEPHPPGCSASLSRLALGPLSPGAPSAWGPAIPGSSVAGALILTVNKKDAAAGLPGDTRRRPPALSTEPAPPASPRARGRVRVRVRVVASP